jgi:hypothetical protein
MDESSVAWQLVFFNLREQGNVCVSMFLEMKTMPQEREAQWWLSNLLFLLLGKNPQSTAFLSEKEEWLQLHHIKHVWYRSLSLYGSGMSLQNT